MLLSPDQTMIRVRPLVRVLPSRSVAAGTWWPSTYRPFVEPRSVAMTPSGVTRISRWRRETPGSSTTMSASLPRPLTVTGPVSRYRWPSISMSGWRGDAATVVAGATAPRIAPSSVSADASPSGV